MKKKSKGKIVCLSIFIFLSLFICVESLLPGGPSSFQSTLIAMIFNKGQVGDKEILPESIKVIGEPLMYIGDTQKLEVEFSPLKTSDQRVIWSVEGDAITLEGEGKIKAVKEGTAFIHAKAKIKEEVNTIFEVKVEDVEPVSIELHIEKEEISIGTTTKAFFSFSPINTTYQEVEWVIENTDIASINERGIIKGLKEGNTTLYVKSKKYPGIISNGISITINNYPIIPVTSIDWNSKSSMYVGETMIVEPSFNEGATDTSFYLEAIDTSILSIHGSSVIGKKEGMTSFYIISNANEEVKKEIQIEVKEVKAVGIEFTKTKYYYQNAQPILYRLVSEIDGLPVTYKDVTFVLENEKLAKIDDKGYIYASKEGKTKLTIIWNKDTSIFNSIMLEFVVPPNTSWNKLKAFVRKAIGHFYLFLMTGVFGSIVFFYYLSKKKKSFVYFITISYGILLGIISELLQLIPKDRACTIKDMIIDSVGYLFGILIMLLITKIQNHLNRKKSEEKI